MASLSGGDYSRTLTLGSDGKSHVIHSRVSFHALRHSHVSALIAAGLDVVTISHHIGHANPGVTLAVYAHLFAGANKDAAAALAIEAAMGAKR
jgi:integrase